MQLEQRMRNRDSKISEEDLRRRIDKAQGEIDKAESAEVFFDAIIENDDLEATKDELLEMIRSFYPWIGGIQEK